MTPSYSPEAPPSDSAAPTSPAYASEAGRSSTGSSRPAAVRTGPWSSAIPARPSAPSAGPGRTRPAEGRSPPSTAGVRETGVRESGVRDTGVRDAGLRAAGVRETEADVLLVLSADLPFLDEDTVRRLLGALAEAPDAEAALLTDAEGRDQPLVAAYRAAPLRRELARIAEERGTLTGGSLRQLTGALRLTRVTAAPLASFDCDTWEDIATARARIREHGTVLDEWITAVKDELGIELDVDTGVLLDLARDAAHGVARPAAPLTTFLVGYAAARAGTEGGPEAVAEAARKAAALAQRWAAEQDEAG